MLGNLHLKNNSFNTKVPKYFTKTAFNYYLQVDLLDYKSNIKLLDLFINLSDPT